LRSHCLSLNRSAQSPNKFENAQRKLLGPIKEFAFSHRPIAIRNSQIANQFSNSLKYFSASMAAAQPDPAAVTACL
jgi:hypothetical protein